MIKINYLVAFIIIQTNNQSITYPRDEDSDEKRKRSRKRKRRNQHLKQKSISFEEDQSPRKTSRRRRRKRRRNEKDSDQDNEDDDSASKNRSKRNRRGKQESDESQDNVSENEEELTNILVNLRKKAGRMDLNDLFEKFLQKIKRKQQIDSKKFNELVKLIDLDIDYSIVTKLFTQFDKNAKGQISMENAFLQVVTDNETRETISQMKRFKRFFTNFKEKLIENGETVKEMFKDVVRRKQINIKDFRKQLVFSGIQNQRNKTEIDYLIGMLENEYNEKFPRQIIDISLLLYGRGLRRQKRELVDSDIQSQDQDEDDEESEKEDFKRSRFRKGSKEQGYKTNDAREYRGKQNKRKKPKTKLRMKRNKLDDDSEEDNQESRNIKPNRKRRRRADRDDKNPEIINVQDKEYDKESDKENLQSERSPRRRKRRRKKRNFDDLVKDMEDVVEEKQIDKTTTFINTILTKNNFNVNEIINYYDPENEGYISRNEFLQQSGLIKSIKFNQRELGQVFHEINGNSNQLDMDVFATKLNKPNLMKIKQFVSENKRIIRRIFENKDFGKDGQLTKKQIAIVIKQTENCPKQIKKITGNDIIQIGDEAGGMMGKNGLFYQDFITFCDNQIQNSKNKETKQKNQLLLDRIRKVLKHSNIDLQKLLQEIEDDNGCVSKDEFEDIVSQYVTGLTGDDWEQLFEILPTKKSGRYQKIDYVNACAMIMKGEEQNDNQDAEHYKDPDDEDKRLIEEIFDLMLFRMKIARLEVYEIYDEYRDDDGQLPEIALKKVLTYLKLPEKCTKNARKIIKATGDPHAMSIHQKDFEEFLDVAREKNAKLFKKSLSEFVKEKEIFEEIRRQLENQDVINLNKFFNVRQKYIPYNKFLKELNKEDFNLKPSEIKQFVKKLEQFGKAPDIDFDVFTNLYYNVNDITNKKRRTLDDEDDDYDDDYKGQDSDDDESSYDTEERRDNQEYGYEQLRNDQDVQRLIKVAKKKIEQLNTSFVKVFFDQWYETEPYKKNSISLRQFRDTLSKYLKMQISPVYTQRAIKKIYSGTTSLHHENLVEIFDLKKGYVKDEDGKVGISIQLEPKELIQKLLNRIVEQNPNTPNLLAYPKTYFKPKNEQEYLTDIEFQNAVENVWKDVDRVSFRRLWEFLDVNLEGKILWNTFVEKIGDVELELKDNDVAIDSEMVQYIKEIFKDLDHNGNGVLDLYEFHKSFTMMGINQTFQQTKTLFEEYDVDQNGNIDFNEFKVLVNKKINNDVLIADDIISKINVAFNKQDYKQTGFLTYSQTRQALESMGIKFNDEQFDALVRKFDSNQDNSIEINEFMEIIKMNIDDDEKDVLEAVRNIKQCGKLNPKELLKTFVKMPKHFLTSFITDHLKKSKQGLPADGLKLDFSIQREIFPTLNPLTQQEQNMNYKSYVRPLKHSFRTQLKLLIAHGVPIPNTKEFPKREEEFIGRQLKICLFHEGKEEIIGNIIRIPILWDRNYEDRWYFGQKDHLLTDVFYILLHDYPLMDNLLVMFEFILFYKSGDKVIEMSCGYAKVNVIELKQPKTLNIEIQGGSIVQKFKINSDDVNTERAGWRNLVKMVSAEIKPQLQIQIINQGIENDFELDLLPPVVLLHLKALHFYQTVRQYQSKKAYFDCEKPMTLSSDIALKTLLNVINCPDTYQTFLTFFEQQIWPKLMASNTKWDAGADYLNNCLLKMISIFQCEEFKFNISNPAEQTLANDLLHGQRIQLFSNILDEILYDLNPNPLVMPKKSQMSFSQSFSIQQTLEPIEDRLLKIKSLKNHFNTLSLTRSKFNRPQTSYIPRPNYQQQVMAQTQQIQRPQTSMYGKTFGAKSAFIPMQSTIVEEDEMDENETNKQDQLNEKVVLAFMKLRAYQEGKTKNTEWDNTVNNFQLMIENIIYNNNLNDLEENKFEEMFETVKKDYKYEKFKKWLMSLIQLSEQYDLKHNIRNTDNVYWIDKIKQLW